MIFVGMDRVVVLFLLALGKCLHLLWDSVSYEFLFAFVIGDFSSTYTMSMRTHK